MGPGVEVVVKVIEVVVVFVLVAVMVVAVAVVVVVLVVSSTAGLVGLGCLKLGLPHQGRSRSR